MRTLRVVSSITLVFAIAGYLAFLRWECQWYMGLIPASIEISEAVTIGGESGFREGCGVAVFKLSSSAQKQIQTEGLAVLAAARQARSHSDSSKAYSQWKETPYINTGDGLTLVDRWQLGMGCARLSNELNQSIVKAMNTSGSFFATTHEAGLVVIPSLGLVVFSHYG